MFEGREGQIGTSCVALSPSNKNMHQVVERLIKRCLYL